MEPPCMVYGGMVGVEVRGMAEAGRHWGVVWVSLGCGMGWSMEVQGISNPDCNTSCARNPARLNPEEPCPMTVPTLNPVVCTAVIARISYASLSVITRLTVLTL